MESESKNTRKVTTLWHLQPCLLAFHCKLAGNVKFSYCSEPLISAPKPSRAFAAPQLGVCARAPWASLWQKIRVGKLSFWESDVVWQRCCKIILRRTHFTASTSPPFFSKHGLCWFSTTIFTRKEHNICRISDFDTIRAYHPTCGSL